MALPISIAVDAYPEPDEHLEALADYDATVREYYDLRDTNTRVDSFSEQIARALGTGGASTSPVLEILHSQRLYLR